MYCDQCGTPILTIAKFCSQCGAGVKHEESIDNFPPSLPPFPLSLPPAIEHAENGQLCHLAGRGLRLGAAVLDSLIFIAFLVPGFVVSISYPDDNSGLAPLVFVAAILCLIIIQAGLITNSGQSLGKRALGIRIVGFLDESNPGFWRGFVLRQIVPGCIASIPFVNIILLIDVLYIFRDDRRCVHDLIAQTKVVIH